MYKTPPSQTKNVPFSEIFKRKENLIVLFSDDILANYRIATKLLNWCSVSKGEVSAEVYQNALFQAVYFLLPDFQKSFFESLLQGHNVKVSYLSSSLTGIKNSLIINFNRSGKHLKKWADTPQTAIMGLGKYVNVKFVPTPTDPDHLINKIGQLLGFQETKSILDLKKTSFNPEKVKTTPSNGRYVMIINNLLKRKIALHKLSKIINYSGESSTVVCYTQKQFFSRDFPYDLKQIVELCYGAVKIVTDHQQTEELLTVLGLKAINYRDF